MKRKDIGTLLVVAIVSAFLSIILSNNFIASSEGRSQKVEVIEELSDSFERPSTKYFNENSVNPTKIIEIGQDPDSKPFGEE